MKAMNVQRFLLFGVIIIGFYSVSSGQTQTSSNPTPIDNATELKNLLKRVGERVQEYNDGMFSIAFTEVVRQQELRSDATPKGKSKEFVYESVVLSRASSANQQDAFPVVTRTLKSVDGKLPEQKNLPQRSKCVDTNPQPAYADPLTFLMPNNQANFIFSYEGEAELQGRRTAMLTFTTPPVSEPVKVVVKDNCFRLSRGLQRRGKVWIDPSSYDVIQLEWQLAESFSGKIPAGVTRVGILPVFRPRKELSYEKSDTTIRFRPVTFENPKQILLLPTSSESAWILKGGGIAGFRTTTDYTRYRRFVTSVEIKDSDEVRIELSSLAVTPKADAR